MTIPQFQRKILSWYKKNRRDLPWRGAQDPYKILVSEVMLQQTQVSRVIPKYKEFLKEFPTPTILARARIKSVLKVWKGLGYWRRALYLKQTAKIICTKNRRSFNFRTVEELESLPGVGLYTARALACFAFGNNEAFLDTNIRRVYLHFFFPKRKGVSDTEILTIAQRALLPLSYGRRKVAINPKEWHYALFDYGATVLKNKKINKRSKHYAKQSRFAGSFRSFRTKAIHFLLNRSKNRAPHHELALYLQKELVEVKLQQIHTPDTIIQALLKDGLIKKRRNSYSL